MKLIIAQTTEIKEAIEYLVGEIYDKYEALNPLITIDELAYDLDFETGDGNFVYVSTLDINGSIKNLEDLKKYKRVIFVATGKKYQNLLFNIFTNEKTDNLPATYLFDLEDAYIVTDEMASKKIPDEE